jgi:hypothetical protein
MFFVQYQLKIQYIENDNLEQGNWKIKENEEIKQI